MIRITDQYFWNFVFGVFFVTLVAMAAVIVTTNHSTAVQALTAFDVVLIVLASQRLVRLVSYDTVTKWFREQFYDAKVTKAGKVTLHKPTTGPRRTLIDLLTCPWCFGAWATLAVSFSFIISPYAYYVVLLLALSSLTSVLQIAINLLGHKAEKAKWEIEG